MPYRNRVTPLGDLIAVPERGLLTGNRGVLHDEQGAIVRRSQVRRWITCVLAFGDRHREVMAPGRYTHLFFVDEATALAAGHRPCAECRRTDYRRFRDCWAAAHGLPVAPGADDLDAVLAAERAPGGGRGRCSRRPAGSLPDGAFVQWEGASWLVSAGLLLLWTPGGYTERRPPPGDALPVLTPPATIAVIGAGYRPGLHPTAICVG